MNKSRRVFEGWLSRSKPVMPVIVIDQVDSVAPMAKALVAGGVQLVEVTLRTSSALAAIEQLAISTPDVVVGAGTVVSANQVDEVKSAGGHFIVSPGFSSKIAERAEALDIAYLPGVATATEIMMALDYGYTFMKFFPAAQAGGIAMLKAFSGPFPQVAFCPTGGIDVEDYKHYLALDNVLCVGGSWIASAVAIKDKNWEEITFQASQI